MTNIKVLKENEKIVNVEIKGHTNYEDYGKDIVCSSISSIVTTTVNAIIRFNDDSINYEVSDGYIKISVVKFYKETSVLLENMIELLKELAITYKKNIKINI